MQLPRASKDLLMWAPSFRRIPAFLVLAALSLPARSIMYSLRDKCQFIIKGQGTAHHHYTHSSLTFHSWLSSCWRPCCWRTRSHWPWAGRVTWSWSCWRRWAPGCAPCCRGSAASSPPRRCPWRPRRARPPAAHGVINIGGQGAIVTHCHRQMASDIFINPGGIFKTVCLRETFKLIVWHTVHIFHIKYLNIHHFSPGCFCRLTRPWAPDIRTRGRASPEYFHCKFPSRTSSPSQDWELVFGAKFVLIVQHWIDILDTDQLSSQVIFDNLSQCQQTILIFKKLQFNWFEKEKSLFWRI